MQFHPHRVAQWLDAKGDWELAKSVYPVYVEVSPVGACNHRCTFCAVDYIGYKPRQIEGRLMRERLREMGELGVKSVMFAGEGEPLLHKEINATVLAASEKMDVAFTTNGVLLDRLEVVDECEWIKVSINAGTRETYAKVHRTKERDWDIVWRNLRDAAKRKGDCTIGVQMVLLPENADEKEDLQLLCDEAGVDYCVFKPYSQHKKSITREYEGYKPISIGPHWTKTVVREAALATTGHDYERCPSTPYMWAYIMASGDVYSCSAYLEDERFKLGNINEQTFKDVWEGEKRHANWRMMATHDISECRVNCRMARVNEYLADFDRVKHWAFI
jgi:radical SAM protein with 4Fe4S-binding SPASM domain